MKSFGKILVVAALTLLLIQSAFADDVTERSGSATVDWSKKEMVFTGDGAPNLKAAANAAAARIGAERAATLSALRAALESLKGVRISSGETIGERMQAKSGFKAEVEGVVRGFLVQETRYYSDGGVQRDLVIPLDGVLSKKVLEGKYNTGKPPVRKAKKAASDYTGVVVQVGRLKVMPALAPKLLDEDGKEVYDVSMVSEEGVETGIVHYLKGMKAARTFEKVSAKPLVVKAIKTPNKVDLVLSNADAKKVRELAKKTNLLYEGRVVIAK